MSQSLADRLPSLPPSTLSSEFVPHSFCFMNNHHPPTRSCQPGVNHINFECAIAPDTLVITFEHRKHELQQVEIFPQAALVQPDLRKKPSQVAPPTHFALMVCLNQPLDSIDSIINPYESTMLYTNPCDSMLQLICFRLKSMK